MARKIKAMIMVVEKGEIVFAKGGVPKKDAQDAELISFDGNMAQVVVDGRAHSIPVSDLVDFDVKAELEKLAAANKKAEDDAIPKHPAIGSEIMAKMIQFDENGVPLTEKGQYKLIDRRVKVVDVVGSSAIVLVGKDRHIIPEENLVITDEDMLAELNSGPWKRKAELLGTKEPGHIPAPNGPGTGKPGPAVKLEDLDKAGLQALLTEKNISFEDKWSKDILIFTLQNGEPPLEVLLVPALQAKAKEMKIEVPEGSTKADLISAIRVGRYMILPIPALQAKAEALGIKKAGNMGLEELVEEIIFAEDAAVE
jgi:hypothetical protein